MMDKHSRHLVFGASLVVGLFFGYLIRRRRNRRKLLEAKENENNFSLEKLSQLSTSVMVNEETSISSGVNDGNSLTPDQANFLKSMLESQDVDTLKNALITIGNMSAFTNNQVLFRECGCLHRLVNFVSNQNDAILSGGPFFSFEILENALLCIANLCLNEENQFIIRDVIPTTNQILQRPTTPRPTKSICMMVLSNFSILENHNDVFDSIVSDIVDQIFREDQMVPSLRLLINLSTSESGRSILECKIPNFLSFSPINHPFFNREDIFGRWLTLMSHLSNLFAKECGIPNRIQKDTNIVDSDFKIRFKSLFFDNQRRDAMKQDLKLYLDKNMFKNDKKELCDNVEYIRAKVFAMDVMLKEMNVV